jgi:excisionase family DNA binding protein
VRPCPDPGFAIGEVARQLGVHPETIKREIKRGNLRAVRVASRPRILQADLDAYLARHQSMGVA